MSATSLDQPTVDRDRWGRPKIGGKTYHRPSTVATAIESAGGLPKWLGARVFEGLRERPDLLTAEGDLLDLVEDAADAGGANTGSVFGTAVHAVVEGIVTTGVIPLDVNDQHVECARSVLDILDRRGFDVVLSECFVVSEAYGSAGTVDVLLRSRATEKLYIGDIKTSGSPAATATKFGSLAWSIQLAIYASGDVLTNQGTVAFSDLLGRGVESDRAVIIHVERATAKATLIDLDLDAGRDAAELATAVITMRKTAPGRVSH